MAHLTLGTDDSLIWFLMPYAHLTMSSNTRRKNKLVVSSLGASAIRVDALVSASAMPHNRSCGTLTAYRDADYLEAH